MPKLSSDDKHTHVEDASVERLLDLDGEIMEMGDGFWVEIKARRVPRTEGRPAGVDYSLCLFRPTGERLLCYDNAHPVRSGAGPGSRRAARHDHVHKGARVKPYAYADAGSLLVDFWSDVERILRKEGVG